MKETNKFLKELMNKSSTLSAAKISREDKHHNKTLLVPIATIGCGKTTLALALSKLFSFGHIQNDDIVGKKPRKFYKKINREFDNHDVVIADRNNHLKELRKALIKNVKKTLSNVSIVAINWGHEGRTPNENFQITYKRIVTRGANHQSLTAENQQVIWEFLNKFERFDSNNSVDRQFDYVINLDITDDIKTNLDIVIDGLKSIIGIKRPREDVIENALEEIKHYKPTVRKFVDKHSISDDIEEIERYKKKTVRAPVDSRSTRWVSYYGIALSFDFQDYLTQYYKKHPNEDSRTFKKLLQEGRIGFVHHITLIHYSELKKNSTIHQQKLWRQYRKICGEGSPQQVKVYIDKIVYDSKIMALIVNRMEPPTICSKNRIAHVTIGTAKGVKPVKSNIICELASSGNHGNEIRVINLDQELIVIGTVKAFN